MLECPDPQRRCSTSPDALYWEFEVEEQGVLLHKIDIFFIDDSNQGWAALVQSPSTGTPGSKSSPTF